MIIIPANTLSAAGGFNVANSCRFNSGSSDYLQWNSSPAGNRQKFTFSIWFKRAKLGVTQILASASYSGSDEGYLYISSGDTLEWDSTNSGDGDMFSSMKLRDTSAWYHLVWSVDTTQASAGNRMKFYLNGTQMTAWSTETQPNVNQSLYWNVGGTYYPRIGRRDSGDYFDGYMAEIVQINNAQLAADSFGEFDEDSGIWKPLESVADLTFGDTGYYLNFQDSSALGDDVSGNGNDFTVNNLTAIDQSTDTCTNNFATANPLLHGGTVATLSEGNLKLSIGTSWKHGIPTIGVSSGKWYMEAKIGSMGEYYGGGVIDSYEINSWGASGSGYAGEKTLSIGYYSNGNKYIDDTSSSYGASYTTDDIISTAIDLDAGTPTVTFYKNGASQGAVNLPTSSNSTGLWFFMPSLYNGTLELNFGSPAFAISSGNTDGNDRGNFEYAVPSGYLSLCTANLSEVLG